MQKTNNEAFRSIKVSLADILDELEQAGAEAMRAIVREEPDATEASAKQLIGHAQGIARAIRKLKGTFGSHIV